jgi:hypothetical protein
MDHVFEFLDNFGENRRKFELNQKMFKKVLSFSQENDNKGI